MGIFDGLVGSVVGGLGGIVGGIMGNDAAADAARENREFQARQAEQQMDFQERMSSSAYTRASADMKRAGLNPMLAYSQGGASSPAGASGSGSMAPVSDVLGKGISSAIEARRLAKELKATDSQTDLNNAIAKTQAAQTELNKASAKTAELNQRVLKAEIPAVEAESRNRAKRADIDEKMAVPDAISNRASSYLGTVNSAKNLLMPSVGVNLNRGEMIVNRRSGEILKERR